MKAPPAHSKVAATIAAFLLLSSGSIYGVQTEQGETKRILVLFSYHEGLPWENLVDESLRNTLASQSTFLIEINVEHTNLNRYRDDAFRHKLVDLYRYKYSHPKMDLIIATGDEAVDWLLNYGEKLFPEIPIVLVTGEHKTLQSDILKPNMTSLVWGTDIRANVKLIHEILPQTRHIFIVAGTSPTDRAALKRAQASLGQDAKGFGVRYLTDISANDLIKEATQLPEKSVLFFLIFFRDAEGKSFVPRKLLSILSERASVPVFGLVDTYLGYGIVGGNLLSAEVQGRRCAEIALRILRGESPEDMIPERLLNQLMFDWRQLKRFKIREDRLPPGSIVKFKTYSFWELYRRYIVAALLLILVQSGLISFLLRQRAQRQRAQVQLAQRLRFEEMLSALSARFVNLPPDRLDAEIERVLESIGKGLNVDRVSVYEISEEDQTLHLVHSHRDAEIAAPPSEFKLERLPWIRQKLMNREMVTFSDFEELPAEAEVDRNFLRDQGVVSLALIPLSTGEKTLGVLSLTMLRRRKKWPHEFIRQCRLVAEVFANALVRKRDEELLMQAEAKYRTVADHTYDWEYWSGPDGKLIYISPSCMRITGYRPQEFMDNPSLPSEIIHPEDRRIWDRHQTEDQLAPREIQFRILTRKGETRWIEHTCRPVTDQDGRFQGYRGSNRDVTERKVAEAKVQQQRDELSHVTRVAAMGELATSLAHEINQPLGAILNYANAAQRFLDGSDPNLGKVNEALRGIIRDDKRATEVIQRFRSMLKKQEPSYSALDINGIIREALDYFEGDSILNRLSIVTELAPGLPAVRGDRIQLQQVILNLALNAASAMSRVASNSPRLVLKSETWEDECVRVSVRDFGKGIDEDRKDRLFESFYTTRSEGLGMGLAVCHNIIHAHGGEIWAENHRDGGAIFYFTLQTADGGPEGQEKR
jgi:PAS domain S-box-containing protein